jgi:hypothetical protein
MDGRKTKGRSSTDLFVLSLHPDVLSPLSELVSYQEFLKECLNAPKTQSSVSPMSK